MAQPERPQVEPPCPSALGAPPGIEHMLACWWDVQHRVLAVARAVDRSASEGAWAGIDGVGFHHCHLDVTLVALVGLIRETPAWKSDPQALARMLSAYMIECIEASRQ